MSPRSATTYVPAGVAVLRASTSPGRLDGSEAPELYSKNAVHDGVAWLSGQWRRAELREAIAYASPGLHRQIEEMLAAGCRDVRKVRRVVLALASYLLRWQERPTPFGLFAGVASARVGTAAKVRWGTDHRIAVRADAAWLGDVLAGLHRCFPLLERLSVVANDAVYVRGDRLVAPGPAPDGSGQELAPVEVSVRHTRPVQVAVEAARTPVRFSALRELLMARFPSATVRQLDGLLAGLLDQEILVSSLCAPMTCLDALGHLCAELGAVEAETIPEIAGRTRDLAAIHQRLSADGRGAVNDRALAGRMRALSSATAMPMIADTILNCDVEIPEQVVREARDAVHVLHRLSPYPLGYPAWRDYHSRFRARYGIGALVPVLDLVADSGLGLPADYLGSARGRSVRQVSERDEKLLAMIQRATMNGSDEIVLTDQVIEHLVASDPADLHLPARVEMAVEIRSESVDDLCHGRFTLVVTGTPRPGSSMAGRHAHLLPAHDRDALAACFAVAGPGEMPAQLSFAPRKRRNENVVRTAQMVHHVIPIGEHRGAGEDVIPLGDLAVTADDRRFFLIQISTGLCVAPRVTHALEASAQTPPLARFLADITSARASVYKAFHFGAAARLPYLPRIRYRRTILSPARWLLSAGDVPGHGASRAEWEMGLDSWRRQWHVPDWVAIVEHDRRQPVDLNRPLHRLVLRNRLDRGDRLELREASSREDTAWLGRRHELVIPMVLDRPPAPRTPVPVTGRVPVVEDGAGQFPARSPVLCARLFGHPARFDEVLTEWLPGLLDAFDDDRPSWWFRRHRQMSRPEADQYLVLYLRLNDPSDYGTAAERLSEWVSTLRGEHLLSHLDLTTYEPQTGRYGHGTALDRAHDVFAADSTAALTQITCSTRAEIPTQAIAAAGFVDIAVNFTGSAQAGSDWLIQRLRPEHGPLDPVLRDHALALADPDGTWTTLRSVPGGAEVVAAWHERAGAIRTYHQTLTDQRDPLTALPSLLHVHHNRAVAVDPARERVTGRLARACALRHHARRTENP